MEIFTNALLAIILLVVLTLLFNYLFTRLIPLNKIQLKKLDYWWLTLSAFALFGLVEKNRLQLNDMELKKQMWFHEGRCSDLLRAIDTSDICFKYTKTDLSPSNFDEIQKMEDSLCTWTKNVALLLTDKIENDDSLKTVVPVFKDEFLKYRTEDIERTIKDYNQSIGELVVLKRESYIGNFAFLIQLFSPLLLIIGLAIRFSKTTAEIRLEKNLR